MKKNADSQNDLGYAVLQVGWDILGTGFSLEEATDDARAVIGDDMPKKPKGWTPDTPYGAIVVIPATRALVARDHAQGAPVSYCIANGIAVLR
jgi:hypothetical protein